MSMDNVAVSEDGIPFVHYLPYKTAGSQDSNYEIETPLVRYAFDIVKATDFNLPILNYAYGNNGYNKKVKELMKFCGFDRKVNTYNETLRTNEYLPLYEAASTKLARKTHVDIMNKVQVDTPEKKDQETCSLKNSGDFFRKIVVLNGNQKLWTDDDGISYVGVIPFLIDENIL